MDIKLYESCLKNDRHSQSLIFNKYYSWGLNVALRYSNNEEDAKEILSNAFLKIFRKLKNYDTSRSFKPWSKKIIVNAAYDYYRYDRKQLKLVEMDSNVSVNANILDHLSYQELLSIVQQLSNRYRSVFMLYCVDGYSHKEISDLLNISVGTSKSNLSKAKKNIIQMLHDVQHVGIIK